MSTAAERYERVRKAILVRLKVDIDQDWVVLRALLKNELERAEKAETQASLARAEEREKTIEELARAFEDLPADDLSPTGVARRIRGFARPARTMCPICGTVAPPPTMKGAIKVIVCACVGDQPVMVRR